MADKLTLDRHAMRDKSTAHLRIYVGGLTDQASVDELYDHFSPYGQVNGIVINKGFGFVQYEDEESAQKAIQVAQGSHFQGKILNVRTALQNADKQRWEHVEPALQSGLPHAGALSDDLLQEEGNEPYDNFGNYIGDRAGPRDSLSNEEGFEEEGGFEGFAPGRGGRGRGARGRGARGVRGRGAPPHREREAPREFMPRGPPGYDRYPAPPARVLPGPDRNDCEIIVVSKALTEYAEYIEGRLKRLGIVVDLLYPMEDVPIGKVLGNIASRGCLYAILVMPQNQENRSLTLTILHGLPQEHRNMPIEDALTLLSRNFQEVRRGGPASREAVWALLGQLADGKTLTVMQYDKVAEYIQEKREQQVKLELGEPTPAVGSKTQVDLQQRILSILNDTDKKQAPAPAQPAAKPALLNDPTVRKALDSILHKFV